MKNNKAWVSWHAARARAARATITQQTLHSTAWACSAPRGAHCACRHHSTRTLHPARLPAARVHTLLRLVMHTPLCLSFHFQRARSTSARYSIHGYMPVGTLAAHPQAVVLPCPRRQHSPFLAARVHTALRHSVPHSRTPSIQHARSSARCSTLLCAPCPIHRLLSCRAHVAPTQLPVHSLKHFPPLC